MRVLTLTAVDCVLALFLCRHNKEERKKRYREEAAVEKRKLLGQKRQRKE